MRRSYVADSFLSTCDEMESKRDWLDRLFPKLESSDKGQALIQQMAFTLADQTSFPNLQNWEDSEDKIRDANEAVKMLRAYLAKQKEEKERDEDVTRRKELAREAQERNLRSQSDLANLRERLDALALRLGAQNAGYEFQNWFFDMMDFCEVDNRRPYMSQGRQIDGSITIDRTTYLIELKFTAEQSGAGEIDSLTKKVTKNALCTMGIMVSISGYSSVAKEEASTANSPLLLLDHAHLYIVLTSACEFADLVRRVRRHASQEGNAFLPVTRFGE